MYDKGYIHNCRRSRSLTSFDCSVCYTTNRYQTDTCTYIYICCSVVKSCTILRDPMDCSTPGLSMCGEDHTYVYSFVDSFPTQAITECWAAFPVLYNGSILAVYSNIIYYIVCIHIQLILHCTPDTSTTL